MNRRGAKDAELEGGRPACPCPSEHWQPERLPYNLEKVGRLIVVLDGHFLRKELKLDRFDHRIGEVEMTTLDGDPALLR